MFFIPLVAGVSNWELRQDQRGLVQAVLFEPCTLHTCGLREFHTYLLRVSPRCCELQQCEHDSYSPLYMVHNAGVVRQQARGKTKAKLSFLRAERACMHPPPPPPLLPSSRAMNHHPCGSFLSVHPSTYLFRLSSEGRRSLNNQSGPSSSSRDLNLTPTPAEAYRAAGNGFNGKGGAGGGKGDRQSAHVVGPDMEDSIMNPTGANGVGGGAADGAGGDGDAAAELAKKFR